jgi:hypothetical protein
VSQYVAPGVPRIAGSAAFAIVATCPSAGVCTGGPRGLWARVLFGSGDETVEPVEAGLRELMADACAPLGAARDSKPSTPRGRALTPDDVLALVLRLGP